MNRHNWVDYLKYHGVFPVAPRDMYLYVHWRLLDAQGTLVIVVFSDPPPSLSPSVAASMASHPSHPGCVRAECMTAGWILRAVDRESGKEGGKEGGKVVHTHCTYFSMADLKGSIPKPLVEYATEPQPLLIHSIAQVIARETTDKFLVREGPREGPREEGRGRWTAQDVGAYVRRIHRLNLSAKEVVRYPWLMTEEERERERQRRLGRRGGGRVDAEEEGVEREGERGGREEGAKAPTSAWLFRWWGAGSRATSSPPSAPSSVPPSVGPSGPPDLHASCRRAFWVFCLVFLACLVRQWGWGGGRGRMCAAGTGKGYDVWMYVRALAQFLGWGRDVGVGEMAVEEEGKEYLGHRSIMSVPL